MNSRSDVSREQLEWVMAEWAKAPAVPPYQEVVSILTVALEVNDLTHFWATVDWLFDTHPDLIRGAIQLARGYGILRDWKVFNDQDAKV